MMVPRFLSGKTHFIPLTATCAFNCPLSGCRASGVYYSQLTLESYPLRNVRSAVNTTPFFAITKPQSWRGCRFVQNLYSFFFVFWFVWGRSQMQIQKYRKVAIWRSHEFWWIRYSYLCVYRSNPLDTSCFCMNESFFALVPISNISFEHILFQAILTTSVFSRKVHLYIGDVSIFLIQTSC